MARYPGLDSKYYIDIDNTGTYEILDQARNTSTSPGTRDTIDVTTRNDTGTQTIPGPFTPGTITVTLIYDPQKTQHQALEDLAQDSSSREFKLRQHVVTPGGTKYRTIGVKVTGFQLGDDIGSPLTADVEFTLQGTWTRS